MAIPRLLKNKIIFSLILVFISNCCYSQPDKKTIEKNVREQYKLYSLAAGSASYEIKKIKIIEVLKQKNDTFIVEVMVKGTTKNYTIANDKRKKFNEKLLFKYFLNSNKEWEYITDNDPRLRMKS